MVVTGFFVLCMVMTSLAEVVMFPVGLVCLSVCEQHYLKSYKWIAMKQGGVRGDIIKID